MKIYIDFFMYIFSIRHQVKITFYMKIIKIKKKKPPPISNASNVF